MSDNNYIKKFLESKKRLEDTILKDPEKNRKLLDVLKVQKQIRDLEDELYGVPNPPEVSPSVKKHLRDLWKKRIELTDGLEKVKISDLNFTPSREYADKELIKMASDFYDLSPEEMRELYVGSGAFKDTYDIPNSNLVLKRARSRVGSVDEIIKDYYMNKRMEELFTSGVNSPAFLKEKFEEQFLERPKMINIPGKEPVLIQKKLLSDAQLDQIPFERRDFDLHRITDDFKELLRRELKEEFRPVDIHSGNIGIDPETGKVKAFDAMGSPAAHEGFYKALKNFRDKLSKATDSEVYRSLLPLAPYLKTAGKIGVPLLGAYSSYSEAKDEGMSSPAALAYAAAEELNPIPISGLEAKAGLEGLRGVLRDAVYTGEEDSVFPSAEAQGRVLGRSNYEKSQAAKDREKFRILRDKLKPM